MGALLERKMPPSAYGEVIQESREKINKTR